MRIDAARDEIDRLDLDPVTRAILLTSLVEAADRVDSTVGVQMAYLKRWAPRAANVLELREPAAIDGPAGRVERADANELAAELDGIDLAYIDPPYNQHSYLGNYHVWETLVRWDAPDHYGIACKRVDCRTRKSPYNLRRQALAALDRPDRARPRTVAPRLVLERGLPPARRDRGAARTARPRRRGRRPAAPLRRRPDRHPRPLRPQGRDRLAPLEHGAPVRLRPRPAPARSRPPVDFARARSS